MPLFFASCKLPASTVKSISAGVDLPSSIIFLISTLLLALRILTLIPVSFVNSSVNGFIKYSFLAEYIFTSSEKVACAGTIKMISKNV